MSLGLDNAIEGRAQRRRGISMLELLVVMGMIALLASIFLPSMAGARAVAKRLLCSSNLAQVVRANLSYANEHESTVCPGAVDGAARRPAVRFSS